LPTTNHEGQPQQLNTNKQRNNRRGYSETSLSQEALSASKAHTLVSVTLNYHSTIPTRIRQPAAKTKAHKPLSPMTIRALLKAISTKHLDSSAFSGWYEHQRTCHSARRVILTTRSTLPHPKLGRPHTRKTTNPTTARALLKVHFATRTIRIRTYQDHITLHHRSLQSLRRRV
jgi:hypothetical protein